MWSENVQSYSHNPFTKISWNQSCAYQIYWKLFSRDIFQAGNFFPFYSHLKEIRQINLPTFFSIKNDFTEILEWDQNTV